MSGQDSREREREEIEMLLPWYVTGRLDRADRARVEGYLARHPDVAAQLDLVRPSASSPCGATRRWARRRPVRSTG